MIIDIKENIIIITQEKASIERLVKSIEESYDDFKNHHLIINLSSLEEISGTSIAEFLSINNNHKNAKKSFVIVSNNITLNTAPEEISITPTIQEAFDIVEMEDIERDLGF